MFLVNFAALSTHHPPKRQGSNHAWFFRKRAIYTVPKFTSLYDILWYIMIFRGISADIFPITRWVEEILHQLVDGLSHYSPSPIIYTFSQLPGVSLPGAGFRTHPPFQSPGSPCSHCPSAKENSCWDQPQEERTLLFGSERAPPRR
jgi:hypothetical protein